MTNRYDTQHRTLPVTANKATMPGLRFHNIPKLQQTQSKINCAIELFHSKPHQKHKGYQMSISWI